MATAPTASQRRLERDCAGEQYGADAAARQGVGEVHDGGEDEQAVDYAWDAGEVREVGFYQTFPAVVGGELLEVDGGADTDEERQ